jgi:hypothetical protein
MRPGPARNVKASTNITQLLGYHLQNIVIRTGILNWLRFTYDFEIGSA